MKILKSKYSQNKRLLLVSALTLAIAILSYTTYAYMSKAWPFNAGVKNTSDSINPTFDSNQNNSSEDIVYTTGKDKSGDEVSPTNKTPPQYDTPKNEAPNPNTLSGIINYAEVSDGNLNIRNTINQRLSGGVCSLTLKNLATGKKVTRKADVIADPTASTCQGFSVPTSELSSGRWDIIIEIQSGDQKGLLKHRVDL